jgi:hypothetical protein
VSYKERVARRKTRQPFERREPAHRCDKFPCSDEKCPLGHYRTPLEVELTNAVRALVKSKLPPGASARIGDTPFWEVRVKCGGAVPIMAYTCCLPAGHSGRCYCDYKSVEFTPESNGEA